MAEAARDAGGTWTGRLIDIRGFEGEITMRLAGEGGRLEGRAEASIAATHAAERHRLVLSGEFDGERLVLKGEAGGEAGVDFGIEARVFELSTGGLGLRGTYEVAARRFSPLRAGVIVAAKGGRLTAVEVKPEMSVQRQESAQEVRS